MHKQQSRVRDLPTPPPEELKDLLKHPGWKLFMDEVEEAMIITMSKLISLDINYPNFPELYAYHQGALQQLRRAFDYEKEVLETKLQDADRKDYNDSKWAKFKRICGEALWR